MGPWNLSQCVFFWFSLSVCTSLFIFELHISEVHICTNVHKHVYALSFLCTCVVLRAVFGCLDPYLYSVRLFIFPVLLIVWRRILCCWLFLCQSFHMQPPPLLTLPLILDHRWKSSSHPADAFRFWWAFLFNSQGERSSRTTSFIDGKRKSAAAFLPLFLFFTFSSAQMFSLQQGFTLKPAQEEKKVEGKDRRMKKRNDDGWVDNE